MTARFNLATALLLCTPAYLTGCKSDKGGSTPSGSGYVSITTNPVNVTLGGADCRSSSSCGFNRPVM